MRSHCVFDLESQAHVQRYCSGEICHVTPTMYWLRVFFLKNMIFESLKCWSTYLLLCWVHCISSHLEHHNVEINCKTVGKTLPEASTCDSRGAVCLAHS